MKALVFLGPGQIELQDVPEPSCSERGMVIRVEACGICGSDLRTYRSGHPRVNPPWIIGHEVAGVVVEVGKGVKDFQVGDQVAVAPPVYCGKCWYCKRGMHYLCINQRELAQAWPGGFAEYMAIPEEALILGSIHRIPEGLSFEEAAISEPASSCVNAHEVAETSLEDTVAIIGAGPIGCFHVEIARARGARKVILMDVLKTRLGIAQRFAPDHLIQNSLGSLEHIEQVRKLTDGLGASVVFKHLAETIREFEEVEVSFISILSMGILHWRSSWVY